MHLFMSTPSVLACLVAGSMAVSARDSAQLPNYHEALTAYQAERAQAAGPTLTQTDQSVIARAAAELAAALPEPGLAVGAAAPDFTLPDAFGDDVHLAALLRNGPVVLTFYRGAWCPYCNLQLRQLKAVIPHIEAHGAALVAITPQQPDQSRTQVEKDGYPFPILSDLDDRVIKAYRLYFEVSDELDAVYRQRFGLDLTAYNGTGRRGLPVPGTFVIDRDGRVVAAFADVDYRQRAEPADIVRALAALSDSAPRP